MLSIQYLNNQKLRQLKLETSFCGEIFTFANFQVEESNIALTLSLLQELVFLKCFFIVQLSAEVAVYLSSTVKYLLERLDSPGGRRPIVSYHCCCRFLEEGNIEGAEIQKQRIEQLQRERRKVLEENNLEHQPRFFRY